VALAFREEAPEAPFLSGLALLDLLYKPTLCCSFFLSADYRRYKTLLGFGRRRDLRKPFHHSREKD